MSRLDNQLAGKYKGVSFFVRSESLNNIGQTRIKHTYPKTGVQYMEPMGQEPFECTIDIFFSGDSFREDFQKFQQAVQDPASGRLFLPTFGVFNSIVAAPTNATSDQTSIGEISLSVTFSETIERPSPIEADISEQDVSEEAQNARDELQGEFEDAYPEPETLNNVLTSSSDATSLADEIKTFTGEVRTVEAFLRKSDQAIRNAEGYASLLLNSGQPIGFLQSIALSVTGTGAFSTFQKIANMGRTLPNAMNDINAGITPVPSSVVPAERGTGELDVSIPIWSTDTYERVERNKNRIVTLNTFRVMGLIGMYETAASQDYTTTDEIDETTERLEEYYVALVENDTTGIIIPEMKSTLDNIRSLTELVLANKRQQAYTVIEIEVLRPVSSFLLSYELYGELIATEAQHEYLAELIAGLNRSLPRNRLTGTVKVVEIGR